MAIFARLVLMIFSVLLSAGIAGRYAAANPACGEQDVIIFLTIGGGLGIGLGQILGNVVVGKPPKD